MKVISPYTEIIHLDPLDMYHIERCGRTAYQSQHKISFPESAKVFLKMLVARKHWSVLEHAYATVDFIGDRGFSHELVRHRLMAITQESTRFCNYSEDRFNKEITFIQPCFFTPGSPAYVEWAQACLVAEQSYFELLNLGATPQEARTVLPNSLKTSVMVTANWREWRHIFKMRTAPDAHPQMREVMEPLLQVFRTNVPYVYDTLEE